MLRLTRRGLETDFEYRASPRPYLWERGGEIPLRHPTVLTANAIPDIFYISLGKKASP